MFSCQKRTLFFSSLIAAALLMAGLLRAYSPPVHAEYPEAGIPAQSKQTLRLGIVPQQSASRLAAKWGPLAAYLTKKTGIRIQFMTTTNIPTFEACLRDNAFDIAYMNPYHYVVFSEHPGYRALAHQADKKLRGVVVVRKDSAATTINDLTNTAIAFPSPGAFGASVVPRAEMRAKGITFTPSYVKSHDSVYRAVVAGMADAGGGINRTLKSMNQELRDQLRVISHTDAYTPHAIATSKDVPDSIRKALSDALTGIATDAPALLTPLGMTGFTAATDENWNDIRALNLLPEQTGMDKIDTVLCPFD